MPAFSQISRFFLNDKVVLRIYFSSGKGRKLFKKKQNKQTNKQTKKKNKNSGAPQEKKKKKESGIICNLTVANDSLHVPIFLIILKGSGQFLKKVLPFLWCFKTNMDVIGKETSYYVKKQQKIRNFD